MAPCWPSGAHPASGTSRKPLRSSCSGPSGHGGRVGRGGPARSAGDKGYSYPGIRQWLRVHHIEAVIPTRKNQPREAGFDRAAYRRRNLIERVIGWYKEYRALGTRYDKLAVNYVAGWLLAIIDKLLRKYAQKLQTGLSDRA